MKFQGDFAKLRGAVRFAIEDAPETQRSGTAPGLLAHPRQRTLSHFASNSDAGTRGGFHFRPSQSACGNACIVVHRDRYEHLRHGDLFGPSRRAWQGQSEY